MSSQEEIYNADDAQIAQYARRKPSVFARLLNLLDPIERATMQRRLAHGQAQLRKHEQQQGRDEGGSR